MMRDKTQMDSIISPESTGTVRGDRDALTDLYTFPAAKERISDWMSKKPQGTYHVVILHVGNISKLTEEYGFAFAMAVLENQAVLLQRCFQLTENILFCRLCKDVLMAFVEWEDAWELEEHCRKVQRKLQDRYFGRREKLRCRVTLGVYHLPRPACDLRQALIRCGKAVGHGIHNKIPFVIYDESVENVDVQIDEEVTSEKMAEEKLLRYDSPFIAFAVSLLSDTTDLDSSLDMLVKQVGWHFGYDEVIVSEFIRDNSTMVSNRWRREEGILPNPEQINTLDIWDDFFSGFDKDGINLTCDVEKGSYSQRDMAFFHEYEIGSFINLLLYSNGHPIGYMTCSRHKPIEQVSETELNTLTQL